MRFALAILALITAAVADAGTVQGRLVNQGDALPEISVRLTSSTAVYEVKSDAAGQFIVSVPPGEYEIEYALAGFETVRETIEIRGAMELPDQELKMAGTKCVIRVHGNPCSDDVPTSRYDLPQCADYVLHDSLIAAAKDGDASALQLLRHRYEIADTFAERHRLAAFLLRKVANDTAIWNELLAHADVILRFPQVDGTFSAAFIEWCEKRGVNQHDYWPMAYDALLAAASDPRLRKQLVAALESQDREIAAAAIYGLSEQKDESSLDAIARTLKRFPEDAGWMALVLATFQSERADRIAMKHLSPDERIAYHAQRQPQSQNP